MTDVRSSPAPSTRPTRRPVVSVVVPVRDDAAHLDACLRLLAAQTRPPDEVVVVDDVDAAAELLEAELRPGDVVLLKASNGAGLWRLGDLLTGATGTEVRP